MRLLRRRTRRAESEVAGPATRADGGTAVDDGLRTEFTAVAGREWTRLANAGTWFTGEQRVAIAAEARAAVDDRPATDRLDDATTEAARRIAMAPATIRVAEVQRWTGAELHPFAYVELVGVVSRLMAIDVAAFGLDRDPIALPEPQPGEPSRERPDAAEVSTGWVPTVGPASAPSSLSAVPAEHDAMFDLHGVLYAPMDQMFDLELDRNGLRRPQIELVAARTSRLNECFY